MRGNLPGPEGLARRGASAALHGLPVVTTTGRAARLASAPSPCQRGSREILIQAPRPMSQMTPREIVEELDKHIVGQKAAKRAVAIALRNRWRRQHVAESLRAEITPKNILMIGPTGVGKTEIARRVAPLADAHLITADTHKFT